MPDVPQIAEFDAGRNLNAGQRFRDDATLEEILDAIRANIVDLDGPIEDQIVERIMAFDATGF